jgi:hypothetical protein
VGIRFATTVSLSGLINTKAGTKVMPRNLIPNRALESIVQDFLVICVHRGCDWTGKVAGLGDHSFNCIFRPDRISPLILALMPVEKYESDEEESGVSRTNVMAKIYKQTCGNDTLSEMLVFTN